MRPISHPIKNCFRKSYKLDFTKEKNVVKKIVSIELCIKLVPGISLSFTYKKCTKSIFLNVILQLCVKNFSHFATMIIILSCENSKNPIFFSVTHQFE